MRVRLAVADLSRHAYTQRASAPVWRQTLFNDLDQNQDGRLCGTELKRFASKFYDWREPTDKQVQHIIERLDSRGDGTLSYEEGVVVAFRFVLRCCARGGRVARRQRGGDRIRAGHGSPQATGSAKPMRSSQASGQHTTDLSHAIASSHTIGGVTLVASCRVVA